MRTGSFIATAFVAATVTAALTLGALAEAKKTGPAGATRVRSINGVSKLSKQECENAKGMIWPRVECNGDSCALQDEDKKWHYICITKQ
jgi:uncharacterized membrane protein